MNQVLMQMITSKYVEHLMSKVLGPFVTIYTLHRPSPSNQSFHGIDENLLEQCLRFSLKRGYEFASIDELVDAAVNNRKLTKPTLCFTLDDGYADQLSRLIPVLLKYQAKPTLFVITDFIDQVDWPWDAKVAYIVWSTSVTPCTFQNAGKSIKLDCTSPKTRVETRRALSRHAKTLGKNDLENFLAALEQICQVSVPEKAPLEHSPTSWEDLRKYEELGLRVGAHSRSHLVLKALNDDQIVHELAESKARVDGELKHPSKVFCYPSGTANDFSARHPLLVEQAGFSSAITTISRPTNLQAIRANLYQIDRIGFPETFDRFVRYSSWIEVLRNKFS